MVHIPVLVLVIACNKSRKRFLLSSERANVVLVVVVVTAVMLANYSSCYLGVVFVGQSEDGVGVALQCLDDGDDELTTGGVLFLLLRHGRVRLSGGVRGERSQLVASPTISSTHHLFDRSTCSSAEYSGYSCS
jgi:hypothetical protein